MSVEEIPEKFSWGGKTFLEWGWYHPMAEDWDCIKRKSRETKLEIRIHCSLLWGKMHGDQLLHTPSPPCFDSCSHFCSWVSRTMIGPQTISQRKHLSLSDSSQLFYHTCEKRNQRQLSVESMPQAFLPGLLIEGIYVLSTRLHCFIQLNTGDWTYCVLTFLLLPRSVTWNLVSYRNTKLLHHYSIGQKSNTVLTGLTWVKIKIWDGRATSGGFGENGWF